MLSKQDNELMCRVARGTPMGEALRSYWLPALMSADLPEPDSDPKHVQLAGENLVAFRDTNGKVGILDEHCCHRGASLTLGRVEECGIRCIYHGWKFAVDGTVMETPNVPDPKFKERFKARAYPVREAGGLIWVYLGAADRQPPFPKWSWFDIAPEHRITTVHYEDCNFVQAIEGLLDSTHLGILHANGLRASVQSDLNFASNINRMQFDLAPRIEVEDTDFGFYYAALRTVTEKERACTEARLTAFVAPCFIVNPNGDILTIVVPASDGRSNFYHVFWDTQRKLGEEPLRSQHLQFTGLDPETLDNYGLSARTSAGDQRPSYANGFHQDREAMKKGNFSGLTGIIAEDVIVSVSSGPIRDRTQEMLSSADAAVARLYRVLLDCAKKARLGEAPVGVNADLSHVVGLQRTLNDNESWRSFIPTLPPEPLRRPAS